jgi:hypothetical protein
MPGNVVITFYPMAVETEVVEASRETPLLIAGLAIHTARMADVLLRMDQIEGAVLWLIIAVVAYANRGHLSQTPRRIKVARLH